ncbi:MAG TPA: ZIP family metal transporter [Actinomycetota bacterium]|nr:ZIP family metal transporter [Actinomycetota bacterium]
MSTAQTVLLGAIAGFTIFLGLPAGRMRSDSVRLKTFLTGISAGILVFLLFDILQNATGPLETAVDAVRESHHGWGHLIATGAVYAGGIAVGLMGLLYVSRMWRNRRAQASLGPGAMAVAETDAARAREHELLHLGMSIALGIGLHNFSEGLAIGQAAHSNKVSLALLLVIGFGLHNATEGFGIIGPLAAGNVRASWKWLGIAGLIGGGPTFLGTLLGTMVSSELLFVAFLALAAGAILYVIGELFAAGRRLSWDWMLWGILLGFLVGLATDMILVAAGV